MGSFVKNRKIVRFLTVLFSSAIILKSGLAFAVKKPEDPYLKAAKERQNQNIEEEENYINWKRPSKYLARMVRNKLTRKYIFKFLIFLIIIVIILSFDLAIPKRKIFNGNIRKIENGINFKEGKDFKNSEKGVKPLTKVKKSLEKQKLKKFIKKFKLGGKK